jgi:hypothetical protein
LRPRNAPRNVALFDAVRADDFIDGQNLSGAAGFGLQVDQAAEHAGAIVRAQVDVIRPPAILPFANEDSNTPHYRRIWSGLACDQLSVILSAVIIKWYSSTAFTDESRYNAGSRAKRQLTKAPRREEITPGDSDAR